MAQGTIKVKTEYLPFSSLAVRLFARPIIEIDGTPNKNTWGTYTFMVQPGNHKIKVYYPWFFVKQCNLADTAIDVAEGQTVGIRYTPARTIFQPGKIESM